MTMWKNIVHPGRPKMAIWHMGIACWVPNATNIDSEHIILITFQLQKWNYECASVFVICTQRVMLYLPIVGHTW